MQDQFHLRFHSFILALEKLAGRRRIQVFGNAMAIFSRLMFEMVKWRARRGMRKLGIPTVLDRFIQQAVMQVLQRRWDPTFSEDSHGFRPKRSAHQAVAKAQQYIAAGHRWVVDLDLEKFFDRVNHDKLMATIARRVTDKRVSGEEDTFADAKEKAQRRGETFAYWYLRRHGYVFVARNYIPRGAKGEIDLVGYDGETLAFIEVRTRTPCADQPALPELSVTAEKQHLVGRTARRFSGGAACERLSGAICGD